MTAVAGYRSSRRRMASVPVDLLLRMPINTRSAGWLANSASSSRPSAEQSISVTVGIAPATTLVSAARALGRSSQIETRFTATQVGSRLLILVAGRAVFVLIIGFALVAEVTARWNRAALLQADEDIALTRA